MVVVVVVAVVVVVVVVVEAAVVVVVVALVVVDLAVRAIAIVVLLTLYLDYPTDAGGNPAVAGIGWSELSTVSDWLCYHAACSWGESVFYCIVYMYVCIYV